MEIKYFFLDIFLNIVYFKIYKKSIANVDAEIYLHNYI